MIPSAGVKLGSKLGLVVSSKLLHTIYAKTRMSGQEDITFPVGPYNGNGRPLPDRGLLFPPSFLIFVACR